MPNNSKATWVCNSCKGKPHKASHATTPQAECNGSESTSPKQSTTCSSSSPQDLTSSDDDNSVYDLSDISDDPYDSDDAVEITNVTQANTDKTASLGNLTQADYDTIESPTGWLDCTIIQQAHIYLKQVNPMIDGFQRTTLGPVRNFDVITSEFVQILHTGNQHWVCTSSVGCLPGTVNVYDSLFHDVIVDEVEQQVKDLMADKFVGIDIVPVQQQRNGSDCGVFSIAFATCIVYGLNPGTAKFDVPQMRPHLSKCLRTGVITPFP